MEDGSKKPRFSPAQPRRSKTRLFVGKATAGEKSKVYAFGMMDFRAMRECGIGKGASLSKEIVLAKSGLAGEEAAEV